MQFCECGNILISTGDKLKCRGCGKESAKAGSIKLTTESHRKKELIVVDSNKPDLPTTTKDCPKCGNTTVYWWLIQTRSADEPPTQFYKCTSEKCNHTWREYK